MTLSNSGAAWTKAIIVQLAIVAVILVVYKAYLPRMERDRAASLAEDRERRIEAFARSMIVEDPNRQVDAVGADGERLTHPQKLLQESSVDEVEQALGAPSAEFSDFRQGQHLVWKGTRHQIEAAFNKGVLYNLRFENLQATHGVSVYESSAYWQAF
jgi:hypothetical protein